MDPNFLEIPGYIYLRPVDIEIADREEKIRKED
jgi:hypothetical protein